MAETIMAYPELRHPFEETPVHPPGSTTVLYQGRAVTFAKTGAGDGLLICRDDLPRVNGFELKPEGAQQLVWNSRFASARHVALLWTSYRSQTQNS